LTHKDARVHCVVLKIRAEPHHTPAPTTPTTGTAVRPAGKAHTEKPGKKRPTPQNPTTCQTPPTQRGHFPQPHPERKNQYSQPPPHTQRQLTDVPPLSNPHNTNGHGRPPGHPTNHPTPTNKARELRCQCSLERR